VHRRRKDNVDGDSFKSSLSSETDTEKESPVKVRPFKHILKPPKFDKVRSFKSFWAQFCNCVEHNGWNRQQQSAYLHSSLEGDAASVLWDYGDEVTGSLSRLTTTLQLEVWTKDIYCLQQAGTPRSTKNERNREITKPSQPTALEKENEALQKEIA